MRVYIPATLDLLATWWREQSIPAGDRYAATDDVRAQWPEAGDDDLEYALLGAAAAESALLQGGSGAGVRRVVLAADVDRLDVPVPFRQVAAVHVDPEPVAADCEDDLAWFGVQEVPALIGDL